MLEERPGFLVLEVAGRGAAQAFRAEAGGHRVQRCPPNDRKGRRHTSTITVAVMPVQAHTAAAFRESDIEWQATRGSGAGGQARNKTSNAVQMRHKPSGLTVRVETERSQSQNRATALRLLAARLAAAGAERAVAAENASRRAQVGTGMRGDKIRTVQTQNDSVIDHRTNKRTTCDRYFRGHIEDLL